MVASGEGRAKLLLFGEHAAVYGHPAVGMSLEDRIRVSLEISEEEGWHLDGVSKEDRKAVYDVVKRLEHILAQAAPSAKAGGGRLRITSAIPKGLGLGSSSALCVSLSSAFYQLAEGENFKAGVASDEKLNTIWQWSHGCEALFHGTPSGIDTGLALSPGLFRFLPHPPDLPEISRLKGFPFSLIVGAVPRKGNTAELVGNIKRRVMHRDGDVVRDLARLGEIAAQASVLLENFSLRRLTELGELASRAHTLLRKLRLSTDELDCLLRIGTEEGSPGGKMSGAGGGGAFYLFMPDGKHAVAAAARLRRAAKRQDLPLPFLKTVHFGARS
jgi:mevalonate kinase